MSKETVNWPGNPDLGGFVNMEYANSSKKGGMPLPIRGSVINRLSVKSDGNVPL